MQRNKYIFYFRRAHMYNNQIQFLFLKTPCTAKKGGVGGSVFSE